MQRVHSFVERYTKPSCLTKSVSQDGGVDFGRIYKHSLSIPPGNSQSKIPCEFQGGSLSYYMWVRCKFQLAGHDDEELGVPEFKKLPPKSHECHKGPFLKESSLPVRSHHFSGATCLFLGLHNPQIYNPVEKPVKNSTLSPGVGQKVRGVSKVLEGSTRLLQALPARSWVAIGGSGGWGWWSWCNVNGKPVSVREDSVYQDGR